MFWWILIIVFIGIYVFSLIVNMIYDYDHKNHFPFKYCNHCSTKLSYEYKYCPECGRSLDDEFDVALDKLTPIGMFIVNYKSIFKKRDLVTFIDNDGELSSFSICLLRRNDSDYLKHFVSNEESLKMCVDTYSVKKVRDGFLKSHLEATITYSSTYLIDSNKFNDDYGLERENKYD